MEWNVVPIFIFWINLPENSKALTLKLSQHSCSVIQENCQHQGLI